MQRRPPSKLKAEPDNKNRKRIIAVVLILLLLSATGAWAMWSREDPQMAKVREMGAQIEELPWDQRRQQFETMRVEYDKLTEEQKDVLRDERRQKWEEREAKEMKDFFSKTKEQQVAELDKRIDQMQEWKKKREQGGDRGRRRGGGGGGGNRGGQKTQNFGKDANGNSASVDRRMNSLDRRSADSRAQRSEYGRMMMARMKERGIAMPSFPGRRG
jgi:hypothetical protein